MVIDFGRIETGMEAPQLRLQTLSGQELGVIPFVHEITVDVNWSDVSTISFTVDRQANGILNPLYDKLTSFKVIHTDSIGRFIVSGCTKESDGVREFKTVNGYSLEKLFEKKEMYLEEGTYNFWSITSPEDTILGRILEMDSTWSVGYVAPKLIGCYRTFDETTTDPLSFLYGDVAEKYSCVSVFDVYKRTISCYENSNESTSTIPVYLSHDNLIETSNVTENTDSIVTRLHLFGSDNLSVRDVNPTGADCLIDLSYFLNSGDLDITISGKRLSDKVREWVSAIAARQTYYSSLTSARASASALKLMREFEKSELESELEVLTTEQSAIIQALALEPGGAGRAEQQAKLDAKNQEIRRKQAQVDAKQKEVDAAQETVDLYADRVSGVVEQLSYETYFTEDERKILDQYMIDGDLSDETFVATDIDTSITGTSEPVSGDTVAVAGASIVRADLDSRHLYSIDRGRCDVAGRVTADVVRGTLDITGSDYVMTLYLGSLYYSGKTFKSGLLTLSGRLAGLSTDVAEHTVDEVTDYRGTEVSFTAFSTDMYFTVNAGDYQKYAVEKELYDYGAEQLAKLAWPVYEFTISSANFLYLEKFKPFKDVLQLGKGIHLEIGSEGHLVANLIGINLEFEDPSTFSLVFSNQYQRSDGVVKLADAIQSASSAARNFNVSKYTYGQTAGQAPMISDFMNGSLEAARNTIIGASNQSVRIDGAGLHIGEGPYQIRLVDSMIAMTDDAWETAKLAIGRFASPEIGEYWGVNADVIGGKLICGNNLIIENSNDQGVMQFRVDSTGAWLYNSTFVLANDGTVPVLYGDGIQPLAVSSGGKIILDPHYGVVAGNGDLFTTEGTTVTPSFIEDGDVKLDSDGMPENASFYLDIRSGDAYFRGMLKATSGKIGGFTIADSYLYSGSGDSRVGINGGTEEYPLYAFWAGADRPENAKFWVKKDGSMKAQQAQFSGEIQASTLTGELTASEGGWLKGCGIDINNGAFYVDHQGNLTLKGNINLSDGAITWGTNAPVKYQYSSDSVNGPWHSDYRSGDKYRRESLDGGRSWGDGYKFVGEDGSNGSNANVPEYIHDTYISSVEIRSPNIKANEFTVLPLDSSGDLEGSFNLKGTFAGSQYHFFRIDYTDGGDAPYVNIYSPAGGLIKLGAVTVYGSPGNDSTYVESGRTLEVRGTLKVTGTIDMSQATVLMPPSYQTGGGELPSVE